MTNSTIPESEQKIIFQYMEKVLSSVPAPNARKYVAQYLREVADALEQEKLDGFKIEWASGQDYMDSCLVPVAPANFIKLNLTQED